MWIIFLPNFYFLFFFLFHINQVLMSEDSTPWTPCISESERFCVFLENPLFMKDSSILLSSKAASSFPISAGTLLTRLRPRARGQVSRSMPSPTISGHNFLYLEFGENYEFLNVILILLKMKNLKPVEVKGEKNFNYLKITVKRNCRDFMTLAPGEVEKIKGQRN